MVTQKKLSLRQDGNFNKYFTKHEGNLHHKDTGSLIVDWHCFTMPNAPLVREYHMMHENGRVLTYSHNEVLEKFVLVVDVECTEQFHPITYDKNNWYYTKSNSEYHIRRWVDEDGNQVGEIELVKR
jgi:hypothetical protein